MRKFLIAIFVIGLIIVPMAIFGCKGKVHKEGDAMTAPVTEATVLTEEVVVTQAPVTEPAPAQTVSQEVPPTAAMPQAPAAAAVPADKLEHNKEIQTALKAAGFYTGNVDGKIGPKTKKAIMEFQKANGLKADGKVGPKTWAALEKYLKQ
jgi:peptidoglycan hydrolase-like protein with peptidoglycan-binding domain